MFVKSKNGQILILTLMIMAIGLIIISPLLSYLDNSYNRYITAMKRTNAYYTADAMMTNIMNDIYRGVDVYNNNISSPYRQDYYMGSEYDVSVVINESPTTGPLPTPSGGGTDWIYADPGVSTCNASSCDPTLLLNSLGYGLTHSFTMYLVGGHQIQVNWAFDDQGARFCFLGACCATPCSYHTEGLMWMTYANGSTIPGTTVNGSNTSAMTRIYLNWSVPEGASANYTIYFKNTNCYRWGSQDLFCGCGSNETRPSYSSLFAATNDTDYTWVRMGNPEGGEIYAYKDYLITATAKKHGETNNIVSITAYVRHIPGPLAWWEKQTVETPSWNITYY